MTFTRDSALWWLVLLVTVATFLSTHFELVTDAFPGISPTWEKRTELASAFGAMIATYLRMSPLSLNPRSELAGQGADPSKALTLTGKEGTVASTP